MAPSPAPLLELRGVTRSFPGVVALDEVSFELRAGEVHALVGENGAGKSTLIHLVSGVLDPDNGSLLLEGAETRPNNPVKARRSGIVAVHQEAELFPNLSIAENLALPLGLPMTRGLIDWRTVYRLARETVKVFDASIDVRAPANTLSVAQRHMMQVAAALRQQAKLVILDEPTSALSDRESRWLFAQVRRLRDAGSGVIYISHRQDEIFTLADRITVLRDGRHVWTGASTEIDSGGLVRAMVGRELTARPRAERSVHSIAGPPRFEVRGYSDRKGRFDGIHLTAHAGEVVGVYGLVGAGRSEWAQSVFGLERPRTGELRLDGRLTTLHTPGAALRAGVAYLPEDRLRQGVFRNLSVRANAVLSSLRRWSVGPLASAAAERKACQEIVEQLQVRLQHIEQPLGQLSGGNQQKVVLGRCLMTEPRVLILDEPTRGVDVGAKDEIHRLLRELAASGCTILMISSELPEVMEYSDRVVVFRNGTIAGEFDPAEATSERIATAALPDASDDAEHREAERDSEVTASRAPLRSGWRSIPKGELGLLLVVTLLTAWLWLTSAGFSFTEVLASASLWLILGLAAATVILVGGVDISVGSLAALAAVAAALVLRLPLPPTASIPLAVIAAIIVGAVGGALNAAVALWGGVHPIVVTLGAMTVYRGAVISIMSGESLGDFPPTFSRLAIDPQTGIRGSLVLGAVVAVLLYLWSSQMRSGRHLYAIGSGPAAARLCGISKARTWLTAFATGGALAGIAGALVLAENGRMQASLGAGWELNAIAVAVIGGVSITGGRGSVIGVAIGAVLLRLVSEALVRFGVSMDQTQLFVGAVLLIAVSIDLVWRRGSEI